ncbi:MAG TPA: hypothetical protein PLH94_00705 [Fimbriimonadaceae bacterium]|nr:hypothetical protein [Fimbriimonadaceae bacterium]
MSVFLYVSINGFYLPCGDDEPRVVHHEGRVLDRNNLARRRGITLGMPLHEAKLAVPEARFELFESSRYRGRRAQWLDVCAEFADRIEAGLPHETTLDLSDHPRPEELAAELVSALRRRLGLKVQAGLAPAVWTARLAASRCDAQALALGLEPLEVVREPRAALAELPTEMLDPVEAVHLQRLIFLGYRTIGEVARAPESALRRQFGDEAFRIRRAACGYAIEDLHPNYPADKLLGRIPFDGEIDDRHTLRAALTSLGKKLGDTLVEQDRQSHEMTLVFETERCIPLVRKRIFTKPLNTSESVAFAINLLADQDPPEEPIVGIRARLGDLTRSKRVQKTLVAPRAGARETQGLDHALDRVIACFGVERIQKASERIEPRRLRVLRAWKEATGWS